MMQYLSTPTAQALSWTLLHSLWQGVLIMFTLILLLRVIPIRFSRARYAVSLGALLTLVAAALTTFAALLNTSMADTATPAVYRFASAAAPIVTSAAVETSWLTILNNAINANIPLITMLWLVGTLAFCLRMAGGWFYINTLRQKATVVDESWQLYIQKLAAQMQVNKLVEIAESRLIQAPVVLGYLKPVILLPVGMISGLTTGQIETILIHELTHIRRHDYIINLVQSFVEAIFFFNPCVWFISQQIRTEREHCCDDAVVSLKGSAQQYIHALAKLEEVRLSRNGLALALAENKNILLNRMKRMMEKSAKKHSARERIIPAVLLVAGLLCASWITIKKPASESRSQVAAPGVKADTTIKKTEKSGRYSRTTVTTVDENGKPHKEVTEEYEGDESLRPVITIPADFDYTFEMPEMPEVPEMPEMPEMLMAMPPMPDIVFNFDVADSAFDVDKHHDIAMHFDKNMADWSKEMAQWDEKMHQWNAEHGESFKAFEEKMKVWQDENSGKLQDIEKQAAAMEKQAQAMEQQAHAMEKNMSAFEENLKKQLVSDGYLKRDEKLTNMQWNNGDIEINGRKIKEEHKAKYNDLHKKYFKENGSMIYID